MESRGGQMSMPSPVECCGAGMMNISDALFGKISTESSIARCSLRLQEL